MEVRSRVYFYQLNTALNIHEHKLCFDCYCRVELCNFIHCILLFNYELVFSEYSLENSLNSTRRVPVSLQNYALKIEIKLCQSFAFYHVWNLTVVCERMQKNTKSQSIKEICHTKYQVVFTHSGQNRDVQYIYEAKFKYFIWFYLLINSKLTIVVFWQYCVIIKIAIWMPLFWFLFNI